MRGIQELLVGKRVTEIRPLYSGEKDIWEARLGSSLFREPGVEPVVIILENGVEIITAQNVNQIDVDFGRFVVFDPADQLISVL